MFIFKKGKSLFRSWMLEPNDTLIFGILLYSKGKYGIRNQNKACLIRAFRDQSKYRVEAKYGNSRTINKKSKTNEFETKSEIESIKEVSRLVFKKIYKKDPFRIVGEFGKDLDFAGKISKASEYDPSRIPYLKEGDIEYNHRIGLRVNGLKI